METFCDIGEHSGTKVCRKFICSSAGITNIYLYITSLSIYRVSIFEVN